MVNASTNSNKKLPRPYNRYNLYFILEREYIIQVRGGSSSPRKKTTTDPVDIATERCRRAYQDLVLPPLPTKYRILDIPYDWFMPKPKNQKRSHERTHGVASFAELSKSIGARWKTVDDETLQFVTSVEKMLKQRHTEIVAMEHSSFPVAKSTEGPRRSSLPNIALDCEKRTVDYGDFSFERKRVTFAKQTLLPHELENVHPQRLSLFANNRTENDHYQNEAVCFNEPQVNRDRHVSRRSSLPNLSSSQDEVPQFFCMQCTPTTNYWGATDELVMEVFGEPEPLLTM